MIEAHTFDAWTRPANRGTSLFRALAVLGGFAAPLFLWLAGVGGVLSAQAALRRTGSRSEAAARVCRRGLEIFVLAFLFRLQAFVVTPGSPLITLFRVDILNVLGPALFLVGVVWALVPRRGLQIAAFGGLATLVAMATPVVRPARLVELLPVWVQWYVRPSGEYTTFTLFPWSGFVLGGAAAGTVLAASAGSEDEDWIQLGLALAGAALVGAGLYCATLPTIYQASSFWTSSPTYFALRAGVLLVCVSAAFGLERFIPRAASVLQPLERFGRGSLFVYWIHVELVYGYASWLLHGRLSLWQTGAAYLAFVSLMYAALLGRDHLLAWWRHRYSSSPSQEPLSAQST
jgi:uncharacterized membrane protein